MTNQPKTLVGAIIEGIDEETNITTGPGEALAGLIEPYVRAYLRERFRAACAKTPDEGVRLSHLFFQITGRSLGGGE
jgi:hypothetical protein